MERTKFWLRVGQWFGAGRRRRRFAVAEEGAPEAGVAPSDGPPNIPVDNEGNATALVGAEGRSDAKLRFGRSSAGMEKLAEEYARVVKLMDGIQQHMSSQDERSERMVQALDRLVENQADAPQVSQRQLEALCSISDAVSADAAARKRIEEELAQLPRIADAQRETMVSIGRQLEATRETNEHVGTAVSEVHRSVASLGDVTESSLKTLERLQAEATVREERLAAVFQEQGRRLAVVAWSAIGLATVVAGIFLVNLLRG